MMLDIRAAQQRWETRALAVQAASDAAVLQQRPRRQQSDDGRGGAPIDLAAYMKHANDMLDGWWALGEELMLKHAQPAAPGVGVPVSYPGWWLEAVGYPDGPPPVSSPDHHPHEERQPRPATALAECIRRCPEEPAAFQRCTRRCLAIEH